MGPDDSIPRFTISVEKRSRSFAMAEVINTMIRYFSESGVGLGLYVYLFIYIGDYRRGGWKIVNANT